MVAGTESEDLGIGKLNRSLADELPNIHVDVVMVVTVCVIPVVWYIPTTEQEVHLMSIIKEFRDFAVKGNMVDMAVGIIIGAAFGKLITSLVGDMIMPPLGQLIGGVNFSDLKLTIVSPIPGREPATLNYGNFIQTTFDFLIVALAIFMVVSNQQDEAQGSGRASRTSGAHQGSGCCC
jgi:large conductance mechanosensitive channel